VTQLGVVLVLVWLLSLHYSIVSAHEDYVRGQLRWERIQELQSIVDRLRLRLEILEPVRISLVESNPLVVSVETLGSRSGPFVIKADEAFLDTLSPTEIEAALAHELGHVWIHTHHPYRQTERLANDIALRVVSRSTLEPVYEKLWQRTGIKGDLAELIGQP
jgi:Zn-dependent protease with chaperone function